MNTKTKREKLQHSAATWISVGLATGVAVGTALGDTLFGLEIGLIGGGAITLAIESRRKKRGPLLVSLAIFALLWIVSLRVIQSS